MADHDHDGKSSHNTHKKREQITEEQLAVIVDQEVQNALGTDNSELSKQRADAMDFYLGEPYGNEVPDRSKVVTREVMDTVEWVMPFMMKLFFSGEEAVRFEPEGEEDVDAAQQETDYCNYVFYRQNPGFATMYQWVKDALLQKYGVIKIFWDDSIEEVSEVYEGLSTEEFILLDDDEDIEVISVETTEAIDEFGEDLSTHDVQVIRSQGNGQVRVIPIPPEEFLISQRAVNIPDSPFCAHRTRKTLSQLRAEGFETDGIETFSEDEAVNTSPEAIARHNIDSTHDDESLQGGGSNESMREVWVTEAYLLVDWDNDGIAELRKVLKIGSKIFENVAIPSQPFAGWTPIILSHKLHGLSLSDIIKDLQLIKSTLLRNMLDNMYLTNNGRYAVVEDMVNLDDLLTSRPHGIVREKQSGMVRRLDTPDISPNAFQLLDYLEKIGHQRTGVSERTQGLDPNQLNPNTAATAVNQVMTAAEQRLELIARVFGETGLKDAFRLIHGELQRNEDNEQYFRLREDFITVDPSQWKERKDMTVQVGLGNGSKDQQLFHLSQIANQQQAIISGGGLGTIVSPQNVFHLAAEMVKATGRKDPSKFYTDPGDFDPNQPTPEDELELQQAQQESELKDREMGVKEGEIQIKAKKLELEQAELNFKIKQHEDDTEFKLAELQLEARQQRAVKIGND